MGLCLPCFLLFSSRPMPGRLRDIFVKIHYQLVRVIAEGGMGTVYEARQLGVDGFAKTVAIKLIKQEYSHIEEFCQNFIGEAKLVSNLVHSNIVQTYHLGFMEGQYYMVMEYIKGWTLEDCILRQIQLKKAMPLELAVFIVSRICRGLVYAHEKADDRQRCLGIVHRDVNPKNILLSDQGEVKLSDFGIAKARKLMYSKEGETIAGKDEYLSPEQARKEITDPRADLFSCGVILSELITGQNIFEGETAEATRQNIELLEPPPFSQLRPEVNGTLNTILHKALEKRRSQRYQSARELLSALEAYMYKSTFVPTIEKLAAYLRGLFRKQRSLPSSQAAQ